MRSPGIAPRPRLVAQDEASLVNYAEFVSAPQPDPGHTEQATPNVSGDRGLARERRRGRYALLRGLQKVTKRHRLRACCRARKNAAIGIRLHRKEGIAYFSNAQRCGYAGVCPVCGTKIAQARADEIERGIVNHLERGGGVEMMMFTFPHRIGMRLGSLLDVMGPGFRRVIGGRPWRRACETLGIEGHIKSLEILHGMNGWHPHYHVLLFTKTPISETEREFLGSSMYSRWASYVEGAGYGLPKRELFRLEPVRGPADVSEYLTKLATVEGDGGLARSASLEMARHDLKGNRTGPGRSLEMRSPFRILNDFLSSGDCDDLALWYEYEECIKGKQLIRWSNGLKASLGVTEMTDQEIVDEDEGGEVVYDVSPRDWLLVCRAGRVTDLLEIVEDGGGEVEIEVFLDGLRILSGDRSPP